MRTMRYIPIIVLFLCAFLIQSCALTLAPISAKQRVVPRFEQASCPSPVASSTSNGRTVRCGFLVVPEDRSQPTNHRAIHLAVEIFKSPGASSVSEPVLFLQGGPGAALLDVFSSRPSRVPFVAFAQASNRDVIMLDQRGTGQSQPALTCPELDATGWHPVIQYRTLDRKTSMSDVQAKQVKAEQQCSDLLLHQGVDPAAYTVSADAEDVRDLRQVLGYKTWNIFAVSYGTRVAQAVMRIDPAGLRSVVLDSVLPEQSTGPFDIMDSTQQALDAVFQECTQDPSCVVPYPHPKAVFLQLINHLNTHPIAIPMMDSSARTASTGKNYPVPANGETLDRYRV